MKLDEIIKSAAQLRDHVQAAIEEFEGEAPHLCNAAGHLSQAVTNLEGQIAAEAAQAKAAAEATPAAAK
jgi:hypothetical protein